METTNLNNAKQYMAQLMDSATDKTMIETLAKLSESIDGVIADTTAVEEENRQLLQDYKEMVKHTSINLAKAPTHEPEPERTLDDIMYDKLNEILSKKGN